RPAYDQKRRIQRNVQQAGRILQRGGGQMKKYFSDLMREISNCIFILKLSWKMNKTFFFIKIPLLIMGVISSFFPLIFLRLIWLWHK
ncbi:MAG: hypothetical protein IKA03_06920, partial [Alphaproteobacteria bacterium]|nr:hypothetical protein [Alphaproteobacteria bacterium]